LTVAKAGRPTTSESPSTTTTVAAAPEEESTTNSPTRMLRTTVSPKSSEDNNNAWVVGLVLGLLTCMGLVGIGLIWQSRRKKLKQVQDVDNNNNNKENNNNNNTGGDENIEIPYIQRKPSLFSLASTVEPFQSTANNTTYGDKKTISNGFHPYFSWINPKASRQESFFEEEEEETNDEEMRTSDDDDDEASCSSGDSSNDDDDDDDDDISNYTGNFTNERSFVSMLSSPEASLAVISEDSTNSVFYSQDVGSGSLDEIEVVSIVTGDEEDYTTDDDDAHSDLTNKTGSPDNSNRSDNNKAKNKFHISSDEESTNSAYKFMRYMSFRKSNNK